jgi:hypothetical protein
VKVYGGAEVNLHNFSTLDVGEKLAEHTMAVRFEVSTAVTMKNGVFWDVMQCASSKNRRFRGT